MHTTETICLCYFLERLLARRRPVMLVGTAGTGKSVLVGAKLASLDPEAYLVKNVPFNYYTTSAMLQGECQHLNNQVNRPAPHCLQSQVLTHQRGRRYGPLIKVPAIWGDGGFSVSQKLLPKTAPWLKRLNRNKSPQLITEMRMAEVRVMAISPLHAGLSAPEIF